MRNRRLAALFAAVAIGLVGCSGDEPPDPPPTPEGVDLEGIEADEDNGLWRLEGDAALQAVLDAMDGGGPVNIKGILIERIEQEGGDPIAGRQVTIVYEGEASEFHAVITVDAAEVELILLDGIGYVRGNEAYAEGVGLPELATGYGCVAGSDSIMAEWSQFTDPAALLALVTQGATAAVSPPTDDGQTVDLIFGEGTPIGTLTVSAQGAPLPSAFAASDESGAGTVQFSDWGEAPSIEVPDPLLANCAGV